MIRFLFLDEKKCEEIEAELHAVYKYHTSSMTTIRYWFNEFKRGWTSIFNKVLPDRLIEVTTEDTVNIICEIMLENRQVEIREIADIVENILIERVWLLHENIGMIKLSAW